jgi:hypothetical protein
MKLTDKDNVNTLDTILGDSIVNFLKSQTVRIKLPLWSAVMNLPEMAKPLTSPSRQLLKIRLEPYAGQHRPYPRKLLL